MNIIDYLKWRGDLDFKQDPFNEVDNLCLCHMAYTMFDDLIDINTIITIQDLSALFFAKHSEEEIKANKSFVADAPYTLKALANTNRFKNLKLHHFVSILNPETTEQFCAFQIDLSENLVFVCFRGTDDSLIGWKEDFKIAYEVTKAQLSSSEYIEKYLKPLKKYIFAGHSKGGNLAIYAAMNAKKSTRKRIISIYSNDGPGIADEFINQEVYQEMKDRYFKIVPEFDVFGLIYDHCEKMKVVKSDSFFLLQHAATSWQVMGNQFEVLPSINPESKMIKDGFDDFMKEVSIESRKDLIEELFLALNELGVSKASDLSKTSITALIKAIKKVFEMNEEQKENGYKFVKIFTDMISNSVNQRINNTKEAIQESSKRFNESVESFFKKG